MEGWMEGCRTRRRRVRQRVARAFGARARRDQTTVYNKLYINKTFFSREKSFRRARGRLSPKKKRTFCAFKKKSAKSLKT